MKKAKKILSIILNNIKKSLQNPYIVVLLGIFIFDIVFGVVYYIVN